MAALLTNGDGEYRVRERERLIVCGGGDADNGDDIDDNDVDSTAAAAAADDDDADADALKFKLFSVCAAMASNDGISDVRIDDVDDVVGVEVGDGVGVGGTVTNVRCDGALP